MRKYFFKYFDNVKYIYYIRLILLLNSPKMKRNFFISSAFVLSLAMMLPTDSVNAQNIGINATGAAPDGGAMLDVSATNKGVLLPRVNIANLSTIAPVTGSSTVGMLVYNTNTTTGVGYYYWDGSNWVRFSTGGGAWELTGNAGTVDGTNFIGTTDNVPFNIRVNNQKAGRIDNAGNAYFGYLASNVSTGSDNTAIGYHALLVNTTGSSNTSVGWRSLRSNTTGEWNTAIGWASMSNNTTGIWNTASGHMALINNTEGNRNSAFGLHSIGANTTGNNNSALGYAAFQGGTTYSYSTAIGSITAITASQQVRIGWNALSIGGPQLWTNTSDGRFKKDVKEEVPGLIFISKLRPVTYHYDMDTYAKFLDLPDSLRFKECEINQEAVLQSGFIAQEVEVVAQSLGYDFIGVDKPQNDKDYYGLRYSAFVVPLVKAVQEQQHIIESQNERIEALERMVLELKSAIEK